LTASQGTSYTFNDALKFASAINEHQVNGNIQLWKCIAVYIPNWSAAFYSYLEHVESEGSVTSEDWVETEH
jgi:hypothetical protein